MPIIIGITMGSVMVAFVIYSIIEAVWLEPARVRQRLGAVAPSQPDPQPGAGDTPAPVDSFPTIARMVGGRGFADKMLLELTRAGIKLKPSEYIGIVAGIALVAALLAAVLLGSVGAMLFAVTVVAVGAVVYVREMQHRRQAMFNRQLPDALSLVGAAIRSGYSFTRAMQMVAEEMPPPISEEFQRAINEINVGLATEAALTRMAGRVNSYDLELVLTAVIIQQEIGGNLAEIVGHVESTIRDRMRVENEISVLTAEGRVSGIILVALPVFLALVIWFANPHYLMPLFTTAWGKTLIAAAVMLQICGGLIMRRMLAVDY